MADISKIKTIDGTTYDIKDPIRYNKIISRGEQLVVNGSGMTGDNTNFSNWIFDGSQSNSSPGSFTRTATTRSDVWTNEYFPVNAGKKYVFEFDMKSLNNTGTMYSMLVFFDVDKNRISPQWHMYCANTLTTLARELKAGDTKVYLTDSTNYRTRGEASHLRALIFWDYQNSFGYLYPPQTYSCNYYGGAWENDSSIDHTNHTITLASAYSGVTRPAGTYVSQGMSGGTYKYGPLNNTKVPTTWTHYRIVFDGTDYSGTNASAKFPPATAYCKVGFLWDYNAADDHLWVTNVSVKELPETVSGIVAIENGGTGKTTANDAANALLSALPDWTANPSDGVKLIRRDTAGSASFGQITFLTVWNYIKGKISSVLGLTETEYSGNAATATNATKVNNHTVASDVPANAKFTDTVTTATTSGSGNAVTAISASNGALTVTKGTTFLTSHQDISGKADKSATVSTVTWDSTNKKLTKTINGTTTDVVTAATLRTGLNVADGAEVNQNAFSNVKVGSTTVQADTKTDTLELVAGSNVTLTPDATNDKVTIAATDTTYESKSAASGGTAVSLVTTGEKYTWNNKSTVPTNHASSATTYGTGTSSNYGHLKLSDSTSSTSGTSGGIAATPSAVKTAYDLANTANGTANTALSGVNGNLIYDHTFTISNGVATFAPHVYQKGSEVTTNYAKSCFTWKYRLIDGSEVTLTTKNDRGCDVTITNMGYGGNVIGTFTPA